MLWKSGGGMASNKDHEDVLYQVSLCLKQKVLVPPSLAVTFMYLVRKGYRGDFRSWDEAFGKPPWNPEKQKKFERETAQTRKVVEAVEKQRGSLNEGAFEAIGRETGVGGKTKVKELLRRHRYYAGLWKRLVGLGRNFP
jgi:hypothetical protein